MAISPEGTLAKKSGFITRAVNNANALTEAMANLNEMYKEAVILNYGSAIADEDFQGSNDHVDKAALVALFATINALEVELTATSNALYKTLYAFERG